MGIVLSIISFILFELYFRMIIRKKAWIKQKLSGVANMCLVKLDSI
jgi:hypothetical protein